MVLPPTAGAADVGDAFDGVVVTVASVAACVGGGMVISDLILFAGRAVLMVAMDDDGAAEVATTSASATATVDFDSCAIRTCSRKLYLFLNCLEQ